MTDGSLDTYDAFAAYVAQLMSCTTDYRTLPQDVLLYAICVVYHVIPVLCRAKLEEALVRMDRVLLAIERDSNQASPYTAELAGSLQDHDATDNLSPALQQASLRSCTSAVAVHGKWLLTA